MVPKFSVLRYACLPRRSCLCASIAYSLVLPRSGEKRRGAKLLVSFSICSDNLARPEKHVVQGTNFAAAAAARLKHQLVCNVSLFSRPWLASCAPQR